MTLPKRPDGIPGRFLRELLLQSGQFALFYTLMMVSQYGAEFLLEGESAAITAALALQTIFLAVLGANPFARFFGSLITPAVYTLVASRAGPGFLFDAMHIAFWVYSLTAGIFQTITRIFKNRLLGFVLDFISTLFNATAFLFSYTYFDVAHIIDEMISSGTGGTVVRADELSITGIFAWLPVLISDPLYGYIMLVFGVFAIAIGLARTDVMRFKHRLHDLFGQYTDEVKRDGMIKFGKARTESKELCIVFADLRGFSKICEVNEPQAVTEMLNVWFGNWAQAIERHGGIIDKFMGDQMMAVFGLVKQKTRKRSKSALADPCDRAVAAILEMRGSIAELRLQLLESGLPSPTHFGAGIHYGQVMTGVVGGGRHRHFTIIGNAVNSTARLESASDTLKTSCVISELVYSRLGTEHQSHFKALARMRLGSKAETVRVYGLKETEEKS
jgi:class 3 adenylate cyclase